MGRVFWSGLFGGNSTSIRQPSNPNRNVGERNNCRRGGNIENDPLAVQSTLASTNPSGSLANLALSYNLVLPLAVAMQISQKKRQKVRYQLVLMMISVKTIAKALEEYSRYRQ